MKKEPYKIPTIKLEIIRMSYNKGRTSSKIISVDCQKGQIYQTMIKWQEWSKEKNFYRHVSFRVIENEE